LDQFPHRPNQCPDAAPLLRMILPGLPHFFVSDGTGNQADSIQ
jgi:hypothetical protein